MNSREGFTVLKSTQLSFEDKPELKVLVINSCQKMAKEITLELMQAFTGASLTYAPTFTLAKLMLAKRSFDLVVASARMPDGKVDSLKEVLNAKEKPPALVVIGNSNTKGKELLGINGYLFSSLKNISSPRNDIKKEDPIKNLGADLRNDLNNPLQEIVAMAYVAKNQTVSKEVTNQALEAITKAAGNLSSVVKNIEEKIRLAVVR